MFRAVRFVLFVSLWRLRVCNCDSSLQQTDIWGPGLSPDKIVLPARYFFVSIRSNENESSPAKIDDLHVVMSGDSQTGTCRLWLDKLDRKNGSFIVRYRLYESCLNFRITLKYKQKHIGDSPYYFAGPIYHEDCVCPVQDFSLWNKDYECPETIPQLDDDLAQFNDVNMSRVVDKVLDQFDRPGSISICYYAIIDNQLYRKCFGQHVGFHIFSDAILLSILRKVAFPDISFFINLGDWPLVKKKISDVVPVFSWCGSDDTHDIVLPTYDLTESTLENMGRVMLDMLSVQGNIDKEWNEKEPKAFWRGRDSRKERLDLIDIAREHPEFYNASLTNFFFFRDKEKQYGPKVPHVSFFKFFDYKYQINIDGSVASYRLPYLLVGDALVFKQESPYYEHFYRHLKPNVHYIPFKRDLTDLTEKLKWAKQHDSIAQTIAKQGKEFAVHNLMPKDVICYYATALNKWSKRLSVPIANIKSMQKVFQKESFSNCLCKKDLQKDEL